MQTKNEIKLVQAPVISHALIEVGRSVSARLAELNIENQVATTETIQTLKTLRADLNKEYTDYENQRKEIKKAILSPYDEFQALYDTEVSEKYEKAISTLKTTIGDFETKLKTEKKNKIVTYFNELILAEKIDFITFENVGIEVKLSDSEKSLKEKCKDYVQKVLDDISLIKTNQYEAEIMVEYKSTLNVARSIQTVQDRKEKERQEAERIKIAESNRRKRIISDLGMVFIDMVKIYEYKSDSEIQISLHELEESTKEEFANKVIRIEEAIKSKIPVPASAPVEQTPVSYGVQYIASPPLEAPVVDKKPEIVTAEFRCKGTMQQLKSLGAYMKASGIIYENI